ncbi:MAG: hypothetical protein KatS3mg031_2459 [Chitinophagales bacterium]|nr:MAG: hypothetical protein KatS3mg031_2459 [Chitinophagales bacterium]
MKKLSVLSLTLFIATASFAGNSFTGNITISTTKNGADTGKLTMVVKNDQMAFAGPEGQPLLLNISNGDLKTIIRQGNQQTIVKLNLGIFSSLGNLPSFLGPFGSYWGNANDSDTKVHATSETQTINGYSCKKYLIKNKKEETTLWVTNDVPLSLEPLMNMLVKTEYLDKELKGAFPMQATTKNLTTGEVNAFQVSVEKKPVEDKLFEFPAGLMEMDMTPLIEQMLQNSTPEQVRSMLDQMMKF